MATKATIIEKTGGVKVDVRFSGNKIILGDDEMTLNLSKYERDDPVHIDIGLNAWGFLTFGVSSRYAVQIEIPARSYKYEESGEVDEQGRPKTEKVAQPFSMEAVTVILWGQNTEENASEGGENDE